MVHGWGSGHIVPPHNSPPVPQSWGVLVSSAAARTPLPRRPQKEVFWCCQPLAPLPPPRPTIPLLSPKRSFLVSSAGRPWLLTHFRPEWSNGWCWWANQWVLVSPPWPTHGFTRPKRTSTHQLAITSLGRAAFFNLAPDPVLTNIVSQ